MLNSKFKWGEKVILARGGGGDQGHEKWKCQIWFTWLFNFLQLKHHQRAPKICTWGVLKKNYRRWLAASWVPTGSPEWLKKTLSNLKDRNEAFWNVSLKIILIFGDFIHRDENHFQKLDIFLKPKPGHSPCGESGLFTRVPFFTLTKVIPIIG